MPLLFSLAIRNALVEVKGQLQDGEFLFVFFFFGRRVRHFESRAHRTDFYNFLWDRLQEMAGIQSHEGRLEFGRGAGCDQRTSTTWAPVGNPDFVQALSEERLQQERRLWEAVTWVPIRSPR